MTEPYRDGYWQSVAEKSHPQPIPGGESWTALRYVGDDGANHSQLRVLITGPHDYDDAIRVRPPRGRTTFRPGRIWVRVQRYPIVAGDNGTRWQGPIDLPAGETALYITLGTMDDKGAKVGHGYGTDIKSTVPVIVDQWMPKLDPRARIAADGS